MIHDVAGSRTRTLIDGRVPARRHSLIWDGRNDAGASVAGGVHFCRIQAGESGSTNRIVYAG